ncbi:MAG: polysaccharide biosynthesis tyrosine autokinase [Gemmatimonadaceae bacterium]|nr:polysaccharide biosynthesis tyrosine autokinase [Gemmatimonadaceae bacterium]
MTGSNIQPATPRETAVDLYQEGPPADWGGGQQPEPEEEGGPNLSRYVAAIRRFKWLILACAVVGLGGGVAASRFIEPEYEVNATILLEQGTGVQERRNGGPIQGAEFLQGSGWQDLLRSYQIVDPIVTNLGLFVSPKDRADSVLFRDFRVDQQRLRPGNYRLLLAGGRFDLRLRSGVETAEGVSVDAGALGDSIGRAVGFQWMPARASLGGRSELEFNVQTPREASKTLIGKLKVDVQPSSPFLFLRLTGRDARLTASTLNAWVEQFVTIATATKKKNVTNVAVILDGQLAYAAGNLASAESALEEFRVRTVTEPTERQTIAPGIEMTNSPVFDSYFRDRIMADNYKRDRETLERILAGANAGGGITREAVLSVPMVNADPAAENLRKLLAEQAERDAVLRRLRESYTDEFPRVREETEALRQLRIVSIPNAMQLYLRELRLREETLNATVTQSSRDLRSIPVRTIEEQRLKRQVEVAAEMYRNLNLEAAKAKLAEAQTVPDVSVQDPAVPPLFPTQNTAPVIIAGVFAAFLFVGLALAILLDQIDKRFRYPEQVTRELGLYVLGVVPVIDTKKGRRRTSDTAAQVVEAFRTIRMNVRYAADPSRPLAVTVTSPGPNDGKSLISSNLALSFAESGARTLLIDGDIRRGALGNTFGVNSKPGLVEYLEGTALIAEVLQPVPAHENLTLLPGGARKRRGPELLATPRLTQLIQQMVAEYDVVIVDSPPLGAGFDAFALATATGNMAVVMRAGVTDRKMADAKLATVRTLPVRIMGAVLNGIELKGAYEYYSYYQEYAARDEELPARIPDKTRKNVSLTSGKDVG